jgi:hypothetical protein
MGRRILIVAAVSSLVLAACGSSSDAPTEGQFLEEAETALTEAGLEPEVVREPAAIGLEERGVKDDLERLDKKYDLEPNDERGLRFTLHLEKPALARHAPDPIVCIANLLVTTGAESEYGLAVSPDGTEVATLEVPEESFDTVDPGVCAIEFRKAMGW